MSVSVVTKAAGLVYFEPEQRFQTLHHVRKSKGVIVVRPAVSFDILLSIFSKNTQLLPKRMTIAYAKRNQLAILIIPKDVSTKLHNVLNLPIMNEDEEDAPNDQANANMDANKKKRIKNSRDTINIEHVDDKDLRTRIVTMLSKREEMWTSGRLGENAAPEIESNPPSE